MKPKDCFALLLAITLCRSADAQTAAFTYQGRLETNGVPVSGAFNFQATLWDAPNGGTLIAGNSPTTALLTVTNGLFLLPLNFGPTPLSDGAARWLQIEVAIPGDPLVALTPRQPLTSAPYAYRAALAGAAETVSAANVTGTLSPAQLPANVILNNQSGVNLNGTFTGTFTGDGAGLLGLNAWALDGNALTTPGVSFLGTTDNRPLEFRVNNQTALRLIPVIGGTALLGGSANNTIGITSAYGSIAGGDWNGIGSGSAYAGIASGLGNQIDASSFMSFIGGGYSNRVFSQYSSIAGGYENIITGNSYHAIGGGLANQIHGLGVQSVIAGGGNNLILTNLYAAIAGGKANQIGGSNRVTAHGFGLDLHNSIAGGANNFIAAAAGGAAIGGGYGNTIPTGARYATIPGGTENSATNYAFAAGRRAKANHTGAFVWADSTDADFASTSNNQYLVRASGGVGINQNNPTAALHVGGTAGVDGIKFPDNSLQTTAATMPVPYFTSGSAVAITTTTAFISPVVTVTLTRPGRIQVTSHCGLGSSAAGGANNLSLYVAYRPSGGALTTVGNGIFGLTVAQNQRHLYGLSGLTGVLPAGTYDVGLAGSSTAAANWNNNEWCYSTAVVY